MIIIFHFHSQSQPNALLRRPPSESYVPHLLGPRRIASTMVAKEAPKTLHWYSTAAVAVATLTGLVLLTRPLDPDSGNKPTTQHCALLVVMAWRVS